MKIKQIFLGKTKNGMVQFFRYVIVGGGATVVQYAVEIVLKELFDINANLANAAGFFLGLLTNYLISTYWVFDESKVKNKAVEFSAFALIGLVGLAVNQGLVWLFDHPLASQGIFGDLIPADKYYLIGQVIATGIAFLWNFFARKYLLYQDGEKTGLSERKEEV